MYNCTLQLTFQIILNSVYNRYYILLLPRASNFWPRPPTYLPLKRVEGVEIIDQAILASFVASSYPFMSSLFPISRFVLNK